MRHFIKVVSDNISSVKTHLTKIREAQEQDQASTNNNKTETITQPSIEEVEVTISITTIIKVLVFIFVAIGISNFISSISHIVILFFISMIFAEALNPFADRLQKIGINRGLSMIIIYFVLFILTILVLYLLIPLLASQLTILVSNINSFLQGAVSSNAILNIPVIGKEMNAVVVDFVKSIDASSFNTYLSGIATQLSSLATTASGLFVGIFNGIFNFLLFLILTFILVVTKQETNEFIASLMPNRYRAYFVLKMNHIQRRMGDWLRGQLMLSIVIGMMTYLVLMLFKLSGHGIGFEETLAVIAAFTEFLPVVGPILAAIPAVLIAINMGSSFMWLLIILAYMLIQWLEGNIIVPIIMKKAVGLSPIVIILGMLVAVSFPDKINPIVGILISIPVLTIIAIFVEDFRLSEEIKQIAKKKRKVVRQSTKNN